MGRRSGVLEFAVLGLLHDAPMHGYELRKRLNILLGTFRALSYGTLYPCLKSLVAQGFLVEDNPDVEYVPATALNGKRSKIVYRLSAEGKQRFEELLADSGPDAWEDEHFGVHFAFFGQTDRAVRMRVLEGAAAGWRSGWSGCATRWPAPASGSTTTPSNSSGTDWSRWSARSAGSTS